MGQQTEAHCVPYINLTKYVVLTLNESKYIGGEGSWNGKTTYCFTASMSLKQTRVSYRECLW
ncbi:hypothetical protein [Vulcanisaeta distributa]|uniref:hypothetical protein n=1 Tax=Vulcanisaeta distributa TaxID=164451 RepID=UPI0006D0C392|nr:hypothetical protein [Vulcanisaeta distributa]